MKDKEIRFKDLNWKLQLPIILIWIQIAYVVAVVIKILFFG